MAIPFPLDDSLYGLTPNLADDYGANLGAMALRGETGTLIVSLDSLIRMSANPFFPFMLLTCLGNFERFIPGKWLGVERRVATDVAA